MKRIIFCILFIAFIANAYSQKTAVAVPVLPSVSVAFKANATYAGGEPIATNTRYKVNFGGTVFDAGRNFSKDTDEFIAPVDGFYHFDVRVSWLQFSAVGSVTIDLNYEATSVLMVSTSRPVFDSNYGTLLEMKKGEKMSVYLKQNTGAQQKFQQVQFSGFKVN